MQAGSQTHIIHKQVIDLHVEDMAMAKVWQNKISEYYKSEILPALEKTCDELITPDKHIRIDKLELDMGTVSNVDLRPELTARLVRKFREEILNTSYERLYMVTAENSNSIHIPSGVVESSEKDRTTSDVIVYFIENGVLPWWCSSKDVNLREVVNELFERAPDHFIQKVWKLSVQHHSCKRLIDLFTEEQLFECFDRKGKYQMKVLFRDFKKIVGTPNLKPLFFSKFIQTVVPNHNHSLDQSLIVMQMDAVVSVLKKLGYTLNSLPFFRSQTQIKGKGKQMKKTLLFDLLEKYFQQTQSSEFIIRKEKDAGINPDNEVNPNNLDIEENISDVLKDNVAQQMSEKPSKPETPGLPSCEDDTTSDHEQLNMKDDTTSNLGKLKTTSDHVKLNTRSDHVKFNTRSDHVKLNKEDEADTKDLYNSNLQQKKESAFQPKDLKHDNFRDVPAWKSESMVPGEGESLEIDNAGAVVLWPYLEMFYKALGLVKNHAFIHNESQERAVQLLHYLVNGNEKAEEHQLPLLKLLCGVQIPDFITSRFELTAREMKESENLLRAVVRNWKVLKNTTPAGLQSSFLRRPGLLKHDHNGWIVSIERIAIDVLLDRLTWPVSVIRLPWNEYTIHVKW